MNHDLFPGILLVDFDRDNRIYTTSLKVAEHFHKRHTHVLDSSNRLIAELPEDIGEPNFRLTSYTDRWNRRKDMYELTHDGFALLAMGFTGKKALEWKVDFLRAFREMEQRLNELREKESRALVPPAAALGDDFGAQRLAAQEDYPTYRARVARYDQRQPQKDAGGGVVALKDQWNLRFQKDQKCMT